MSQKIFKLVILLLIIPVPVTIAVSGLGAGRSVRAVRLAFRRPTRRRVSSVQVPRRHSVLQFGCAGALGGNPLPFRERRA